MPKDRGDVTWNFETGDLRGWTTTGTAFLTQPTYGDNSAARGRGQPSKHEGNYWIGSYENRPTPSSKVGAIQGDGPTGTLTSKPFIIKSDEIDFLVGGGCSLKSVRVELLVDDHVARKTTGTCYESMHRKTWKVAEFKGKEAQIRIVDDAKGGWGHINVDDFRFIGVEQSGGRSKPVAREYK